MHVPIGIFGGTFDPPHISHTLAVLYALETGGLERIVVIPCFKHPLGKSVSTFEHRLAMTRLAMEPIGERAIVSDIEARRDGASYTIDTVRSMIKEMPNAEISLIIGSDILKETRLWKDFAELEKMARIIVIPRPGGENPPAARFFLPDISSTEIRRRLKSGEDVLPFLSRRVLEYIRRHKLYQE